MREDNIYFDKIDTAKKKAYWIGFLWSDCYCWIRKRKNSHEYGLKLDLTSVDYEHLVKFKNDIGIYTPIKQYKHYSGFLSKTGCVEHLFTTNI